MGNGNVEEVTCSVIGGATYNQVCAPDSEIRAEEDEDTMTGVLQFELKLCGLCAEKFPLLIISRQQICCRI